MENASTGLVRELLSYGCPGSFSDHSTPLNSVPVTLWLKLEDSFTSKPGRSTITIVLFRTKWNPLTYVPTCDLVTVSTRLDQYYISVSELNKDYFPLKFIISPHRYRRHLETIYCRDYGVKKVEKRRSYSRGGLLLPASPARKKLELGTKKQTGRPGRDLCTRSVVGNYTP